MGALPSIPADLSDISGNRPRRNPQCLSNFPFRDPVPKHPSQPATGCSIELLRSAAQSAPFLDLSFAVAPRSCGPAPFCPFHWR